MKVMRTLSFALLLGVGFSAAAMADCVYPKTPTNPPNGSTATEAEMVAGKQTFNDYQSQVNTYLECLDKETQARMAEVADKPDQIKQIKKMADQKHNAAIDELQARADEFNKQLRAYKNKGKS